MMGKFGMLPSALPKRLPSLQVSVDPACDSAELSPPLNTTYNSDTVSGPGYMSPPAGDADVMV